jgi:hypothetical protein
MTLEVSPASAISTAIPEPPMPSVLNRRPAASMLLHPSGPLVVLVSRLVESTTII